MGTNAGEDRGPYFFLSHAHPPAPPTRRHPARGPRGPVERLFEALWDHLGEMATPLAKDADIGMIDSRIWLGEDWQNRLSVELARCKVFVPVLSPRFFASEWCGKEWWVFEQRVARVEGVETDTKAIVPVHWIPFGDLPVPEIASKYQFWDVEFPESYERLGLYALLARPDLWEDCDRSLWLLAERIRRVARRTVTEPGEPMDVAAAKNPFEPTADRFEHMLSGPAGAPPPVPDLG
ncbi:TIR-like protein FxsC [Streptacidiphilus albus]|jgi:hypothetical protein|uniref:TIR-like protein FxsC n=1 Tax=Streptacidiphilus albus TaxID=105425 RepID=UPI0006906107|nr:TIR-like protein FxsC [Streptacidiphilus albus]